MKLLNKVLVCSLMAFCSIASANVNAPYVFKAASDDKLYVASAGEVMLTFISKTAAYSNDLFLQGNATKVLNNQSALEGQTFSLGSFQAGTELAFKILVNTTGETFFSGLASNNRDKVLHTAFEINPNDTVTVGFEDLIYGGDKDYDDLVFKLSNVKLSNIVPTAAVPEVQSYAMLLAGLFMLTAVKRRKS